jgi:hypothetical protein
MTARNSAETRRLRFRGSTRAGAGQHLRQAGGAYRTDVRVAPAGFEPAVSALRGLRPSPLDDGAARESMVGGVGVEPTTSCV